MSRLTMPRRYGELPGPPGERRVACDYCGMTWYRSDLRRDPTGFLACPDDQQGRDVVTLDRANRAHLERALRRRPPGMD